jgi:3-hydroxybutyrate dehydrogenase
MAALTGKTALVTGSTSGIGRGIAEHLAGQGCNIVLNGLGEAAEIEALRVRLAESAGVAVRYSDADMRRPDQIAAMIAGAETRFGALDILVNNAGIQHVAAIEDFPPEAWDRILAINLSSSFHTIRAALPGMKARGWGRIVNIASVHGLVASVHKVAYVAAKHGLVGLTKVVALEAAAAGVTCNAICPGWVRTPLVEQQIQARANQAGQSHDDAQRDLLAEPAGRKAAQWRLRDHRADRPTRRLPVLRWRRPDHRRGAQRRRRLARAVGRWALARDPDR